MKITRSKIATTITVIAASALLLTGCASGQSKADACKQVETSMSTAMDGINANLTDAVTDPSKMLGSLDKVGSTFDASAKKISNPDVKKAAQQAADGLNSYVSSMKTILTTIKNDPSKAMDEYSKVTDQSSKLQSTFSALSKVCSKP